MSRHAADRPPDVHPDAAADLEWCHDAVQGVSRTFAITVDVLDEPMASYICVGYLLCRIADTIEDAERIPPAEQTRLLRLYDRTLDPDDEYDVETFSEAATPHLPASEERNEDWTVVAEAPRVVHTFEHFAPDVREAITPPVRELTDGMAMFIERYEDTGGLRIQSREELEEYCYYAAGTVGNLITNLVTRGDVDSERQNRLYERAEEFGLLLQLVNIAKDVRDDYEAENNVYLPAEWLDDEGVPQDSITAPEHRGGATTVVRRTANHARKFLDPAQTYLEHVPTTDGNTLAAWAIPFLLSVGTLRELVARPEDALSAKEVKVSRQEVFAVIASMSDASTASRESLSELREAIAHQPFHRTTPNAD